VVCQTQWNTNSHIINNYKVRWKESINNNIGKLFERINNLKKFSLCERIDTTTTTTTTTEGDVDSECDGNDCFTYNVGRSSSLNNCRWTSTTSNSLCNPVQDTSPVSDGTMVIPVTKTKQHHNGEFKNLMSSKTLRNRRDSLNTDHITKRSMCVGDYDVMREDISRVVDVTKTNRKKVNRIEYKRNKQRYSNKSLKLPDLLHELKEENNSFIDTHQKVSTSSSNYMNSDYNIIASHELHQSNSDPSHRHRIEEVTKDRIIIGLDDHTTYTKITNNSNNNKTRADVTSNSSSTKASTVDSLTSSDPKRSRVIIENNIDTVHVEGKTDSITNRRGTLKKIWNRRTSAVDLNSGGDKALAVYQGCLTTPAGLFQSCTNFVNSIRGDDSTTVQPRRNMCTIPNTCIDTDGETTPSTPAIVKDTTTYDTTSITTTNPSGICTLNHKSLTANNEDTAVNNYDFYDRTITRSSTTNTKQDTDSSSPGDENTVPLLTKPDRIENSSATNLSDITVNRNRGSFSQHNSYTSRDWLVDRYNGYWNSVDTDVTDTYESLLKAFKVAKVLRAVLTSGSFKGKPAEYAYEDVKSKSTLQNKVSSYVGTTIKQEWRIGKPYHKGCSSSKMIFSYVPLTASNWESHGANGIVSHMIHPIACMPWKKIDTNPEEFEEVMIAKKDGEIVGIATDVQRIFNIIYERPGGNGLKEFKLAGCPEYFHSDDLIMVEIKDGSPKLKDVVLNENYCLDVNKDMVIQSIKAFKVSWKKGDKLGRWRQLEKYKLDEISLEFSQEMELAGSCQRFLRRVKPNDITPKDINRDLYCNKEILGS